MAAILNVLKVIGYVVLGFGVYQALIRIVRHNWHFPAPSFITVFLNSSLRGKIQDPVKVIQRSGINPGSTCWRSAAVEGSSCPTRRGRLERTARCMDWISLRTCWLAAGST